VSDRRVVVTGASRGLGAAIAEELLKDGFQVIGMSRSMSAEVERLADRFPSQFVWNPFDLSDTAGIGEWCRETVARHGRVWGLVNNAALGIDGLLATLPDNAMRSLIEVNLTAPILLCKYLSRGMILQRSGRIVNISSVAAGAGYTGLSAYGATKAGIIGLTKGLSRELGKSGVCVNAVCPGFLETEMTSGLEQTTTDAIRRRSPLGRLARVEDVAQVVRMLFGPAGESITGAVFTVDAGGTV